VVGCQVLFLIRTVLRVRFETYLTVGRVGSVFVLYNKNIQKTTTKKKTDEIRRENARDCRPRMFPRYTDKEF